MSRRTHIQSWKKRVAKEWLILVGCVGSVWGLVAILLVTGRQKIEYVDSVATFEVGITFYGIAIALRSIIWACRTLMKNPNSASETTNQSQFNRN